MQQRINLSSDTAEGQEVAVLDGYTAVNLVVMILRDVCRHL